jgi:hypothetical protein
MLFMRIALLAVVPVLGIGSAPAAPDPDPALVWARQKCLGVYLDKGFDSYQSCVAFYYEHYPIDPFDP